VQGEQDNGKNIPLLAAEVARDSGGSGNARISRVIAVAGSRRLGGLYAHKTGAKGERRIDRNRKIPCNRERGRRQRAAGKSLPGVDVAMLSFGGKTVYLACGCTDMRKSINGLAAIVEGSFALDPFDDALFVFCNKARDRLKILEWDGDGFWLYFKRLEKGRFRWPAAGEEATMTLTGNELSILLGGARVELKLKRNEVTQRRAV